MESDDEQDHTFHLTSSQSIIPPEITDVINNLSKRCDKLERENNELQQLLKARANVNQTNPSYSNAVLDINKASTLLDESIKDSLSQQRSLFGISSIKTNLSMNNASSSHNIVQNNVVADTIESLHKTSYRNNVVHNNVGNGFNRNTNQGVFRCSSDPLSINSTRNNPQQVDSIQLEELNEPAVNPQMEVTMQHINMLTLNESRRHLPKISAFDGKPEKWLTFQRDVERNWREGQYSDEMMKHQIRQALNGQALARVDSLMDYMTANQIMELLKESYGNSNIILETAKQKLLNVKLPKPLTHTSCIEITTYIANYMSACTYAGLLATDSNISSKIHNQLEPFHQQMYYEYFFNKFPNATTRMERLDTQFEFLNSLSRTLPIGAYTTNYQDKSNINSTVSKHQVHSISSSHPSNDDYKFEIRDEQSARYIGYNLEMVNNISKQCLICDNANHYTVECRTYRDMEINERYDLANSKHLCTSCMISTDHLAKNCVLKIGCGYKVNKNLRCTAKHHITLHKINDVNGRKQSQMNSSHNAEEAEKEINESYESQSSSSDEEQEEQSIPAEGSAANASEMD